MSERKLKYSSETLWAAGSLGFSIGVAAANLIHLLFTVL